MDGASRRHLLVVGSYMEDQVFSCAEFPRAGETIKGRFARGAGGKGSNQAVAAARMGAPTWFVGAVGKDGAGDFARACHRQERVGGRLIVKPSVPTGCASIWVDAAGQNRIVIASGANELLKVSDIPTPLLRAARMVMTQWEGDVRMTTRVLARAKAAGATTLLNPAPFVPGVDLAALRHVDILVPNESEFVGLMGRVGERLTEAELRGLPRERLHRLCCALKVPAVIVTLGDQGCLVSTPGRWQHLPACLGLKVVDTTGAGDAFCGGFAAAWLKTKEDLFAAAKVANAVAGLSVTKPGTSAAMPRAAAVAKFLRKG